MQHEPDSQPPLGRFTLRWLTVVWVTFVGTVVLLVGSCIAWTIHDVSAY